MKGYGYLLWAMLPLLVIGLAVMVLKIRQSRYRTVLNLPAGGALRAAMVEIGITVCSPWWSGGDPERYWAYLRAALDGKIAKMGRQ